MYINELKLYPYVESHGVLQAVKAVCRFSWGESAKFIINFIEIKAS